MVNQWRLTGLDFPYISSKSTQVSRLQVVLGSSRDTQLIFPFYLQGLKECAQHAVSLLIVKICGVKVEWVDT